MSFHNERYPQFGQRGTGYINMRKTCMFCGKHNEYCICIEWSIFRGDDDVVNVCKECLKTKDITEIIAKKLELDNKNKETKK